MGRLQDLFARGVVLAAAGAKKMRELQVRLLADEVRDELEHVEPYGFTSEPKGDGKPEAFALFFDGDRSHGVVFAVADRRFRILAHPLSEPEGGGWFPLLLRKLRCKQHLHHAGR